MTFLSKAITPEIRSITKIKKKKGGEESLVIYPCVALFWVLPVVRDLSYCKQQGTWKYLPFMCMCTRVTCVAWLPVAIWKQQLVSPKSPQRNNPFASTGLYYSGEEKPHRQETIKPLKLTVANGQGASGHRGQAQEECTPRPVTCQWLQLGIVACPITTPGRFLRWFWPVPRPKRKLITNHGHSKVPGQGGSGRTPPVGACSPPQHRPGRDAPGDTLRSPARTKVLQVTLDRKGVVCKGGNRESSQAWSCWWGFLQGKYNPGIHEDKAEQTLTSCAGGFAKQTLPRLFSSAAPFSWKKSSWLKASCKLTAKWNHYVSGML